MVEENPEVVASITEGGDFKKPMSEEEKKILKMSGSDKKKPTKTNEDKKVEANIEISRFLSSKRRIGERLRQKESRVAPDSEWVGYPDHT